MGLGGLKSAWQRQTLYFGHERRDKYSVLLVDNRGMGDSDKPLMRYSTSDMAKDLAEVLAHIGWIPLFPLPSDPAPVQRVLHIVGISMGGMIAQELALLLAPAISTLTLCNTAAVMEPAGSFTENIKHRLGFLVPKSVDQSVGDAARQLFSHKWLLEPDNARVPDPKITPKCHPPAGPATEANGKAPSDTANGSTKETANESQAYLTFPTNAHRFIAQELHKRADRSRFPTTGFLLQLIAAGWHRKTPEQLRAMADAIGRERITIMHGDHDNMISLKHGQKLIEWVQPGQKYIIEGCGHVPMVEREGWFNGVVEERCAFGEKMDGRA